jgi:predicted porin
MKKSLIALAVLAAAGTASAQSSVTMFGIVDAVIQRINNSGGASVTRMTQGAYNSSRFGVRGVEDLGGGMSASFWLEAGLNNDDGTGAASNANNQVVPATASAVRPGTQGLVFNRRSTVSLAGGWGEVRLGRDYTPQFWNLTVFDPYGTVGVGTNQLLNSLGALPTAVRASNSIGYFLPANLGGFYGQVQYYLGENASNTANKDDGTGYGFRLGWANGPFDVAVAAGHTKYVTGNADQRNIAGQWNAGFAKIMAQYAWDNTTFSTFSTGRTKGKGWLLGALVPVGAGEVRFSYAQYTVDLAAPLGDPRARKLALGYVHNLSKRTALYVTAARVNNSNGSNFSVFPGVVGNPSVNAHSTGYDLGIRHSF